MTKEETMIKFNEIYADFIKENNRANYYREAMDNGMEIDSKTYEQTLRNMVHSVFNVSKKNMTQEQIATLTQSIKDDNKYRINPTNIDYNIVEQNRKPINQGKSL